MSAIFYYSAYLVGALFFGILIGFWLDMKKLFSKFLSIENGTIKDYSATTMRDTHLAPGSEYNEVVKTLQGATQVFGGIQAEVKRFSIRWFRIFVVWGILFFWCVYLFHPNYESILLKKLDTVEQLVKGLYKPH